MVPASNSTSSFTDFPDFSYDPIDYVIGLDFDYIESVEDWAEDYPEGVMDSVKDFAETKVEEIEIEVRDQLETMEDYYEENVVPRNATDSIVVFGEQVDTQVEWVGPSEEAVKDYFNEAYNTLWDVYESPEGEVAADDAEDAWKEAERLLEDFGE